MPAASRSDGSVQDWRRFGWRVPAGSEQNVVPMLIELPRETIEHPRTPGREQQGIDLNFLDIR
jgi:hypothetical protein